MCHVTHEKMHLCVKVCVRSLFEFWNRESRMSFPFLAQEKQIENEHSLFGSTGKNSKMIIPFFVIRKKLAKLTKPVLEIQEEPQNMTIPFFAQTERNSKNDFSIFCLGENNIKMRIPLFVPRGKDWTSTFCPKRKRFQVSISCYCGPEKRI